MPSYTELLATAVQEIWPTVLVDNFFKGAPFFAYILRNMKKNFSGGAYMQFPFLYGALKGGSYAQGDVFNLTQPQIISAAAFVPKFYYANVTEYLETIGVFAKGPRQFVDLVGAHMDAAMKTINAIQAVAFWRHGQATASTVTDNRVTEINGFSEALNNGTDNSWEGNVFPTYGTQTRGSSIGSALSSTPYFGGDSAGNAGTFTYNVITEQRTSAVRSQVQPDLAVSNKALFNFAQERIQPQQRFVEIGTDPVYWGAEAIKIGPLTWIVDDYAPSAVYGVNDPDLGNYLTSTFTSVASPTAASNLPVSTTITVAEVLGLFNTKQWYVRPSDNPLFNYGFTGFKVAQNSTMVAGQILSALNLYCLSPWGSKQLYGFSS